MEGITPHPEENILDVNQIPQASAPQKPKFFTKKKIILFSSAALLILLLVSSFYFLNREGNQTLNPIPDLSDDISNSGFDRTVPDVEIANYSFQTTEPEIPAEIPMYSLKTDFTKADIDKVANVFSLSNGVQEENEITYTQTTPENSAILNFNTVDGSFIYQAFTPTPVISTNPQTAARTILTRIGYTDTLIDCEITYKHAETPDITYVECHRSWDRMGLPLVSLPGFYNTPEEINLSQMEPGIIDSIENKDPAIIQVSTGQNGLSRPTDFNTATVLVNSDGSIVSIVSNLRFIENSSRVASADLKTAAAAKAEFNNPLYSVVLPAGEGVIDLEKVFPGNKGAAQNAIITGYDLVYLEKLRGEKQTTYEPFYIIRGEATLDNGYTTKLVQAVPALTKSSISQEESLQLGTFSPAPTTQVIQPTNPPQEVAEENVCSVRSSGITESERRDINYVFYSLDLPGYGKMEFAAQRGASHTLILRSWENGGAFTNARNAVDKLFENSFVQTYTSLYRGIPQILPYTDMAGYYKEHPAGSNTPAGAYAAGIPDPRGIKGASRQQMLKNYESKVLAFDRGENVNPDGPGFSLVSETGTNETSTGNSGDWNSFFLIDENSLKNPCYITGSSPSVFIRGNGIYQITPSDPTYAEPVLNNTSWFVQAENSKLFANDKKRDFLYYEFDSAEVRIKPTNQGYSFSSQLLSSAISKIAQDLDLTKAEEKQLFNEVNNEISGNSKYITLKIVSREELDAKLPLQVSPIPNQIVRLHFIIEEGNEKVNLEKPALPKIFTENAILELGASKSNQR